MTGHFTPTKVAWFGIPLVVAAILAIINTTSQGFLWEGPNSRANLKTADATMVASDAAQKDAANKLQAAIEQATAVVASANAQATAIVSAANLTAQAQRLAAKDQADAIIAASKEVSRAQNAEYDQITKRFIGDPVEKADALNNQIVRLQNELESGRDTQIGQTIPWAERLNRLRKLEALQLEHKIQSEITKKNWNDAIGMITGATSSVFGDMGGLFPTGYEPKPVRRIVQEP